MANVHRTLQQRLGFQDPELTSPAHDELVLWIGQNAMTYMAPFAPDPLRHLAKFKREKNEACAKDLNHYRFRLEQQQQLAKQYGPQEVGTYPEGKHLPEDIVWTKVESKYPDTYRDYSLEAEKLKAICERLQQIEAADMPVPEIPAIRLDHMKYEVPVTTETNFIVGFLDVTATLHYPSVALEGILLSKYRKDEIEGFMNDQNGPCGGPKLIIEWQESHFAFEAKTSIKSLGELLRQLNTYKEYFDRWWNPHVAVVSPDTRFRDVILQQGFGFWESPKF